MEVKTHKFFFINCLVQGETFTNSRKWYIIAAVTHWTHSFKWSHLHWWLHCLTGTPFYLSELNRYLTCLRFYSRLTFKLEPFFHAIFFPNESQNHSMVARGMFTSDVIYFHTLKIYFCTRTNHFSQTLKSNSIHFHDTALKNWRHYQFTLDNCCSGLKTACLWLTLYQFYYPLNYLPTTMKAIFYRPFFLLRVPLRRRLREHTKICFFVILRNSSKKKELKNMMFKLEKLINFQL